MNRLLGSWGTQERGGKGLGQMARAPGSTPCALAGYLWLLTYPLWTFAYDVPGSPFVALISRIPGPTFPSD